MADVSTELKIAHMNVSAVTKKLSDYEAKMRQQDQRISSLTQKVQDMESKLNAYASLQALADSFGPGPTAA